MTEYRTRITAAAHDDLRAAPRSTALRILRTLAELESDPYGFSPSSPDTSPTPMTYRPDRRALRVGDYRVVYTVESSQVTVWAVHQGRPIRSS